MHFDMQTVNYEACFDLGFGCLQFREFFCQSFLKIVALEEGQYLLLVGFHITNSQTSYDFVSLKGIFGVGHSR